MKQAVKAIILSLLIIPFCVNAAPQRIVNVYAWTGEVPDYLIKQFEKETGIRVNFAAYENNEIMYAKLRANPHSGYDVVMPSSYFVDRMHRQQMLRQLDKTQLPNWKYVDPAFQDTPFDPDSEYCAPYIWGTTGMYYNTKYFAKGSVHSWNDLWQARFDNQLMLLNEMREVFAATMFSMGYDPNDKNPEHIKEAYLKLRHLMPNVKVFSTETVISIMIDEDANAGMAWNGDAFKAMEENSDLDFVYPKEGFVIWVDSFAVPKNAPHTKEAYEFINFMLRPDISKQATLATGFATTNLAAKKLLPKAYRDSKVIYPPREILKRGTFQLDLGTDALQLYQKYWEMLKMSG